MSEVRPHGGWPSPFTTELVTRHAVSIGELATGEQDIWWSEMRPHEQGRVVVVRHRPGGQVEDVLPEGFSARTRVHEYGGGAWCLHDDVVFFANWEDQRLYRFDPVSGDPPVPIAAPPDRPAGDRYADLAVTPDHRWVLAVRERHGDGEASNEVVAVPTDGEGAPTVLVSGPDFVSFPRPSPDGEHVCWTQWDHPDMPWDSTELWVGDVVHDEGTLALARPRKMAGGAGESVFQPAWSPTGVLHFVSDRTGWWNLYRCPSIEGDGPHGVEHLGAVEGEVGVPQWVFNLSRYAFLGTADPRILCAFAADGWDRLALVDGEGRRHDLACPYTALGQIRSFGDGAVLVAGSPTEEASIVLVDLPEEQGRSEPTFVVVRPPRDLGVAEGDISHPEPVRFQTAGGVEAHALIYRPANARFEGPDGQRPPLIVTIHGGPTGAARALLQVNLQFWTSRGFAVADVNYRGSTGYGRAYRSLLDGAWGVADVEDCVRAAAELAARGEVDATRMAIRGSSAGGFTALCALVFHDQFSAAASLYGVTDLEALARDTHKFESRYLDRLVGPYPETRDRYRERSPIHHTGRLRVPLIVLQGAEDEIVPPSQAEALVAALRSQGVPHAYVLFEGEQHGFRQATTIRRALEAELSFYAQVFGFDPADDLEPVRIETGGE